MTREIFLSFFDENHKNYVKSNWKGDNAFQGLMIIAKYFDITKKDVVCGATHDEIYSVDIDEIIKNGIIEEDVKKLRKLNWSIQDDEFLSCFV